MQVNVPMGVPLKLQLDHNQINVVLGGLNELPFKISAPVIDTILQQLQSYSAAPVDVVVGEATPAVAEAPAPEAPGA